MTSREREPALAHQRFQAQADTYRGLSLDEIFARIHESNLWGAEHTRSGLGSELDSTRHLRTAIPELLHALGATTLLDIPCGDFGWLRHADLDGIDYTGADIVPSLVWLNNARYASDRRRFVRLDITNDPLPAADVVLCRDCMVHLSFANIARAVERIRASGSRYLLATTFPEHAGNEDIQDGDWRVLNMELPPFNFGPPLARIVERCTEGGGTYSDKTLGLWLARSRKDGLAGC